MSEPTIYISIATALFSLWVYLRHDAKLKKQERKLQEFELQKWTDQKAKEKQANLVAWIEKYSNGKCDLVIENRGTCVAKDCIIVINEAKAYGISSILTPFSLHPSQRHTMWLTNTKKSPPDFTVQLSWKDDFSTDKKRLYKLQV